MKVFGSLIGDLPDIPAAARRLEADGYAGAYTAEINNDPFFPALLAAEHSETIELTTAIAVAFARNPMTMAQLAHDLNQFARGRFVLGIGSQIRAHVTRRYGMPWSRPAARMREFVLALRAIWACWHEGTPLAFEGEFYRHTLMTPMFVPRRREYPAPRVRVAGVGPLMTAAAAEVADGLIAHGFTTARYLREVSGAALAEGLARGGKRRADVEVIAPIMVVTGEDEPSFVQNREAVRSQLAFYASTPAYAGVLELHGWEAVGTELTALSKAGRWAEMGALIDDGMLGTFAVVSESPERVPQLLRERYGELLDGWMCTVALGDPERQRALIAEIGRPS